MILHLLFAFLSALIFTLVFVLVFRRRGPWGNAFLVFLVIFFASWVGGLWLAPIGPLLWGGYWLPFLLAGLFISLVIIAVFVPSQRETTVELVEPEKERVRRRSAFAAAGIFFWILLGALIAAILIRY